MSGLKKITPQNIWNSDDNVIIDLLPNLELSSFLDNGKSMLAVATKRRNVRIVSKLLELGQSPSEGDRDDIIPYFICTFIQPNFEILDLFLQTNFEPPVTNMATVLPI